MLWQWQKPILWANEDVVFPCWLQQTDKEYWYNSVDGNAQWLTFSFCWLSGNLITSFEMFGWKHTYLISLGFQFNHLDGQSFYGGSCGGFAGGTQMAGSAPQPVKAQEQQQQQDMPTNLTAQQQFLQIGEQQISSYSLCCQRWMHNIFKVHAAFALTCILSYCVLASALRKRAAAEAKHSAKALLDYCTTGDIRFLLAMQRQLCGVQDENGDTWVYLVSVSSCIGKLWKATHWRFPENYLNNLVIKKPSVFF